MPMYRQLWLALILSTLLGLAGSLVASTLNARAYLQDQLRTKNTDNAVALALSLSQKNADPVEIELAVSALFDSGHYSSIRVVDPGGKPLVERIAKEAAQAAPGWFVRSFPISAPAGVARITNGWKQIGTVFLSTDTRAAYRTLWHSACQLVAVLMLAGLVAACLGSLILGRLKRPLDSLIEQARAITERRFITRPPAGVPELRQLGTAMNFMVTRLKAIFDEEADRLETVRRKANCDAVTGLANRDFFLAQLRAACDNEQFPVGSLMLVRVAHLAQTNRRLGRETTDTLLGVFARTLDACAQRHAGGLAARLNGADFGLLLPGQSWPTPIAEALLEEIIAATSAYFDLEPVAFIGAGRFGFGIEPSAALSRVDAALAQAEAKDISGVREALMANAAGSPRNAEQWAHIIRQALEQGWVKLVSFPVSDFSGQLVHRECPLRIRFSADGDWMPAGEFLPLAERLDMTADLDLKAVELGLDALRRDDGLPGLAINLSARSVQAASFRARLRALLASQPPAVRSRLWLEVNEHGALAHFEAFRALCAELSDIGCRLGLEHFGRMFSQIGRFHDLGLDYLKVDASFVRGIDTNEGNQSFLKGLTAIAHGIGLQVYAEGVASDEEFRALAALAVDGATGPAVRDPAG